MQKVLLAVHGGRTAEGAAHVARSLNERTGARIDAVGVLEPAPTIDIGYAPVYVPDAASEEAAEEEFRHGLRHQLELAGLGTLTPSIVHGARVPCITAAARSAHSDLIVVGIGPHHLTDRALGGETALHLAQGASTPVLAVPARMRTLPKRILVAVDFSLASCAAARVAASLLRADDTLELMHVADGSRSGRSAMPTPATDILRQLEATATQITAGLTAAPRIVTSAGHGSPARTLLESAVRSGAELIALGSHGYSSWQRLFLGSVSSKVLRLAECAVLIYPARCVS